MDKSNEYSAFNLNYIKIPFYLYWLSRFFFRQWHTTEDILLRAFIQRLLTHSTQWCNTTEQPLDGACHITVNPVILLDYSVDLPWVSGALAINLSAERCTRLSGHAFSSQWACGATCRSPATIHGIAGLIRLIWERTASSLRAARQSHRRGGLQELCHRKLGQPFGTTIAFSCMWSTLCLV